MELSTVLRILAGNIRMQRKSWKNWQDWQQSLEMMRMSQHLARCGKAAVLVTAIWSWSHLEQVLVVALSSMERSWRERTEQVERLVICVWIWKRQILADVADTDVWSSMHQQQVSLVLQERRWSMRHVQQSWQKKIFQQKLFLMQSKKEMKLRLKLRQRWEIT